MSWQLLSTAQDKTFRSVRPMVHAEAKAQGTLKPELVPEEFPLVLPMTASVKFVLS